jgi:hypothetical protein
MPPRRRRQMEAPLSSDGGAFVELPGYTCPVPVLKLALALEDAGCRLTVRRNGTEPSLLVSGANGQRPTLAADTRAEIARWKLHLMALVDWIATQEG